MEKYYLAVDAGGSKVHLLVFDSAFHRIDFDVAASSNPTVNPIPEIIENMRKTFDRLFGRNPQIKKIECVYICSLCPADILLKPLEDLGVSVGKLRGIGEGDMGMFAGGRSSDAVVALSGTGSDIYYEKDGHCITAVGGWGAIVSDEGSGYWIGREAMIAAIHDYEHRGEKTMLTEMICDRLYPNNFRKSIYSVYESSSPARSVAAMSRLVGEAARKGDAVSLDIIARAAKQLAEQTRTIYLEYPEALELPLMVTGGSWKGYMLFSKFEEEIDKLFPGKKVQKPLFEPIVGGVFCHAMESGLSDEEAVAVLKENFAEDMYVLPEK